MNIMKAEDPNGVDLRRGRRLKRHTYRCKVIPDNISNTVSLLYVIQGPNHLWHTDGYEKLNPYGFSIALTGK